MVTFAIYEETYQPGRQVAPQGVAFHASDSNDALNKFADHIGRLYRADKGVLRVPEKCHSGTYYRNFIAEEIQVFA